MLASGQAGNTPTHSRPQAHTHLGERPGLAHAAHIGQRLLEAQRAPRPLHDVHKVEVAVAHLAHCRQGGARQEGGWVGGRGEVGWWGRKEGQRRQRTGAKAAGAGRSPCTPDSPPPTDPPFQSARLLGLPTRLVSSGCAATYRRTLSQFRASNPADPGAAACPCCCCCSSDDDARGAATPAASQLRMAKVPLPASWCAGAAPASACCCCCCCWRGTKPRSVMIPSIRAAGVTSKLGFHTAMSAATRCPRK